MKPLTPRKTEFELALKADREHAARGAALHKQKPLAVNIHDDKQRIRELEAAARMVIDDALDYKTTSDPARVTWTSINALRRAMGELLPLKGAK